MASDRKMTDKQRILKLEREVKKLRDQLDAVLARHNEEDAAAAERSWG